jgi:hypothetical protein
MKTIKLVPFIACLLFACTKEDITCLETKEVVIQTINPSVLICSVPDKGFHIEHKWDTSYTGIITECEAQDQIELLNEAWEDLIIYYESKGIQNHKDSLYADFMKNNPAVYSIIDSGN